MSQPSWIGRSLSGRYQIESLLGQGGMSAVYKATDPNLKRVVAIKLIHSHLSSDTQFIQRFEEEAAAVASLRHPNIVQVYDFNSDQGVHYMVLEFVPGETLQNRLQRLNNQGRKLSILEAINFSINICDALGYAHQRGIIHRDIKPANIMLDLNGQAILMDFGIVKIIGSTSHTATGAVLGTASYISPELIRSEQADASSDIYSLGITMFEMLSGEPPFKADSAMSLMMMHLNNQVPDPRSLRADIPSSLVNILLKSLEKDRKKRYQSVAELSADLKRALNEIQNSLAASATSFNQPSVNQPAATIIASASYPAQQQAAHPSAHISQPTIIEPQPRNYTNPPLSQSQQYTPPPFSGSTGTLPKKNNTLLWAFGLGGGMLFFVVMVVIVGLLFMASQLPGKPQSAVLATNTPAQISTKQPTAQPTDVPPTQAPQVTATQVYVAPIPEATPTFPTTMYVKINAITLSGNEYFVQYETFGFTEKLPWTHIHFFFNTVPPDQAGRPGSGPWKIYGGPRPFAGYTLSDKPEGATQMCALVANANHTVIPASGNCFDLPK